MKQFINDVLKSAITGIGAAMMLGGAVSFVWPSIVTMASVTALSVVLGLFCFCVRGLSSTDR